MASAVEAQVEVLDLAGRRGVQKSEAEIDEVRAELRFYGEAGRAYALEAREAAAKVRKLRDELSNRETDLCKIFARIRELEGPPPISGSDAAETALLREKLKVTEENEDVADRGRRETKARVQALERLNKEFEKKNEY